MKNRSSPDNKLAHSAAFRRLIAVFVTAGFHRFLKTDKTFAFRGLSTPRFHEKIYFRV